MIAVTTLLLRGVDAVTITRILRQQSTNLVEMSRDAPRVLFLSAFLLDQGRLWKEFVIFNLVLVPVERWIGTYRWLAVIVAGHVGASIATTIGIWLQVRAGIGGRQLAYPVDVGISYAIAAAAGVLAYRLRRPWGAVLAIGLLVWTGVPIIRNGSFTDWGHMTALLIGFALGPVVRPAHGDAARRRVARTAGLALIGAAIVAVLAAAVGNTSVVLPPGSGVTSAVTLGRTRSCGAGCQSSVVRLADGTRSELRLPAKTDVAAGTRLTVRPDPQTPGRVTIAAQSKRVDVRGLLGEVAVVAMAAGAVLLIVGMRRPVTRHVVAT